MQFFLASFDKTYSHKIGYPYFKRDWQTYFLLILNKICIIPKMLSQLYSVSICEITDLWISCDWKQWLETRLIFTIITLWNKFVFDKFWRFYFWLFDHFSYFIIFLFSLNLSKIMGHSVIISWPSYRSSFFAVPEIDTLRFNQSEWPSIDVAFYSSSRGLIDFICFDFQRSTQLLLIMNPLDPNHRSLLMCKPMPSGLKKRWVLIWCFGIFQQYILIHFPANSDFILHLSIF